VQSFGSGQDDTKGGSAKQSVGVKEGHRFCGLTFELTGPRRQDALARAEKMYRVHQLGPRWPAVAGPVERGVRPQRGHAHD
jgi:hypothetical protein